MLHPSYSDLMKVVNSEVEPGEAPVVNSRYSIVMATSKRARQLIAGEDALVSSAGRKPLSMAVEELNQGKIKILTEEEALREKEKILAEAEAEAQMMRELKIDLGEEAEQAALARGISEENLTEEDTEGQDINE